MRTFHSEESVSPSVAFNCPSCKTRLTLKGLSAEGKCPICETHLQLTTTLSTPSEIPPKAVKKDRFFRPASSVNTKPRKTFAKTEELS